MKETMRAGIVASLLLASTAAFAQDDPYGQRQATEDGAQAEAAPAGDSARESASEETPARASSGADAWATAPGAASGEPGESEEERAHQAWVESIWSSP